MGVKIVLLSLALMMSVFGLSQMPRVTELPVATVVDHWPPKPRLVQIDGNEYFAVQSSPGYWVLCPRTTPVPDPKDLVSAPAQEEKTQ